MCHMSTLTLGHMLDDCLNIFASNFSPSSGLHTAHVAVTNGQGHHEQTVILQFAGDTLTSHDVTLMALRAAPRVDVLMKYK